MGTTTSPIFTGSSQFSQDFSTAITNAVNLASLPITQLQGDVTNLTSQATALNDPSTGLGAQFAALQNAIDGINQAMSGSSFSTDISNTGAVEANVSDGAMEGNYSIDVQNIGVYATSQTTSAWVTQPLAANGKTHPYQLVIDTGNGHPTTINITPTGDNSATSVAQAINLAAGNLVQASVVYDQGANDPRISLQSNTLGPVSLQLNDGSTQLQTQGPAGKLASYAVDGNPAVASNSRTVTVAPGLTVTMLEGDSGNPVNLTVTRSTSALSDALTTFTKAYNAAVDGVDAQRGQTAGPLGGQSIVSELGQTLSSIATYVDSNSSFGGLSGLGFDLGVDGHLTYDSSTFESVDYQHSAAVTAFFGSETGSGFLQAVDQSMTSVDDPQTGLITTTESDIQNQINDLNSQISTKQDQVNQLQQNLQTQMAAADAAIATMEQQYQYLDNMFAAMQTADQQYR